MKRAIYIILVLVGVQINAYNQIPLTGIITDNCGAPLPGVSIVIKGTSTGVITNLDGEYSIEAPIGSVLVISYVGMESREITVTADMASQVNSQETDNTSKRVSLSEDKIQAESGVGDFRALNTKESLKVLAARNKGTFRKTKFVKARITTGISTEHVAQLPQRQSSYIQGRNSSGYLIWRGAETGEQFSWGPPIENMEYDGAVYNYDIRGQQVPYGTGNGKSIDTCDLSSFFNNGLNYIQTVYLGMGNAKHKSNLLYNYKSSKGVIPYSKQKQHNVNITFENDFARWFKLYSGIKTLNSTSDLLNGFSQHRIYSSLLRTPVGFDIYNNVKPSEALNDSRAFELPDGAQRSYAVGVSDNPYWLVNNITDQERNDLWFGHIRASVRGGNFTLDFGANYLADKISNKCGFAPQTSFFEDGIYADRSQTKNTLNLTLFSSYHFYLYSGEFDIKLESNYQNTSHVVSTRIFERADVKYSEIDKAREVFNGTLTAQYSYLDYIFANASLYSQHSTSLANSNYSPGLGVAFNLDEILDLKYGALDRWKISGLVSNSIKEAPLDYRRGMLNTTLYSSAETDLYFEDQEILLTYDINPEKITKKELGTSLLFYDGKFNIDAQYYVKEQEDYIYPVSDDDAFLLENVGNLRTKGIDIGIGYRERYGQFIYRTDLSFHRCRTIVTSLFSDMVIIGGFTDVSSVMMEGQEYGVLLGSDYLYDDKGNRIIGDDGFPLVNPDKQILGKITPDYEIGINFSFDYRRFSMSLLVDALVGGQVWNGTKNNLSYLGLSAETAEEREVRDHIYDGVTTDGRVNNRVVDFYNRELPVEQNRWVRYGPTGVASDAIETATSVRFSEIRLGYKIPSYRLGFRSLINIECYGKNLFHISEYSGPDPQNMFMGQSNNLGFDFYNLPPIREYGITLSFEF